MAEPTPLLGARTLDRQTARTLPPGPKWPTLVQTVLFAGHRKTFFPRMRARYGDVFTIRLVPSSRVVVVLSRPEDIRDVFTTPPTVMHAGEGNQVLKPIMGDHSLLLIDDEDHARTRRQLMPAFLGNALRGYAGMIADLARAEVESWPVGQPFRLHDRMRDLTLEVILQVVFGVTDSARLAELRPLVDRIVAVRPIIMLGGFYPQLLRLPPWRTYLETQRRVDEILYDEIARRRDDVAGRNDVLSRLLAAGSWSDVELRDQLVTLLLAGHETTATGLAWAFHELARRPDELAAAQRAADSGDDERLEAITKESLRLHPVVYQVGRRLTETVDLAGYRLPRGTTIMAALGLVHADGEHYPAAGEFRPDRFLSEDPPAAGTWIPFGGGARRCIGAGFSLLEATEILRATLSRYDVHPVRPEPETAQPRNVTLVPSRGCEVVVTPRG
ncbi:cytochrome P450 [Kribbella flavida DSM 17836]|uniref:Cytochrome P450 n=1 Tax=Kribbella flavida (strain DSM 17836 / JCM 10339 / NBRC 14399) TaxID=479435 RepID=D2Q034_KRIFD|nr:cytochrome P450 [Kribbella flavida]ADB30032.1 cytochrome P450 [Kribbella flavida DSM 17836]